MTRIGRKAVAPHRTSTTTSRGGVPWEGSSCAAFFLSKAGGAVFAEGGSSPVWSHFSPFRQCRCRESHARPPRCHHPRAFFRGLVLRGTGRRRLARRPGARPLLPSVWSHERQWAPAKPRPPLSGSPCGQLGILKDALHSCGSSASVRRLSLEPIRMNTLRRLRAWRTKPLKCRGFRILRTWSSQPRRGLTQPWRKSIASTASFPASERIHQPVTRRVRSCPECFQRIPRCANRSRRSAIEQISRGLPRRI